jgi:hypothetical protein
MNFARAPFSIVSSRPMAALAQVFFLAGFLSACGGGDK